MYNQYLVWLLLVPLILSLIAFATRWLGRQAVRVVEVIHLVSISAVLVLGLLVVQGVLVEGKVVALNDWLHVDALAAVFLGIVAVVGFLVGLYSIGYIRNDLKTGELNENQVSFYYGLFNLFLFTMLLVVTSNNIIMMWVAVEATTLGSAFLVGIYGHRSSLGSGLEIRDHLHRGGGIWAVWHHPGVLRCSELLAGAWSGSSVDGDRAERQIFRPHPVEAGVCLCADRIWHQSRYLPDACLAAGCA